MPKIHVMTIGDVNPKVVEEITEIIDEFMPVDNGLDERCDDCEVMVPDGQGNYPDGDEGRRVCAECAEEVV
tara:strand:- start:1156 stop:1368 length:213 start_codon:yes stop_codon:yes gene_type:complete